MIYPACSSFRPAAYTVAHEFGHHWFAGKDCRQHHCEDGQCAGEECLDADRNLLPYPHCGGVPELDHSGQHLCLMASQPCYDDDPPNGWGGEFGGWSGVFEFPDPPIPDRTSDLFFIRQYRPHEVVP